MVVNVSIPGCAIQSRKRVQPGSYLEMRMLIPDTRSPLHVGRAYTYNGCLETMREEASRLGVTFRTVMVRGTTFGRSLIWPFEPGYACEATIGPERPPSGAYPNVPPLAPQG